MDMDAPSWSTSTAYGSVEAHTCNWRESSRKMLEGPSYIPNGKVGF